MASGLGGIKLNNMEDKYKTKLTKAVFTFYQEGNCIDGGDEELEIRCESSNFGLDEGCFYVLKTEQWAFDSIDELKELIERVNKVIN